MEAATDALGFNPKLPFTGLTIPGCTRVMPIAHFQRIIESGQGDGVNDKEI